MHENRIKNLLLIYPIIQKKYTEIGFKMPSDILIGTLLKSLAANKPGGNFFFRIRYWNRAFIGLDDRWYG
ncbi:MAG: hypothetical protein ACI9UV_002387 [Algoriphagus sp.]|jgi:hypothetical protein